MVILEGDEGREKTRWTCEKQTEAMTGNYTLVVSQLFHVRCRVV